MTPVTQEHVHPSGGNVMNFSQDSRTQRHELGNGVEFLSGRLPEPLLWANALFEHIWSLHPQEKHWIKIHGRLVQTPRYQQAYGKDYHYTGRVNSALPIPEELKPLHAWVRDAI